MKREVLSGTGLYMTIREIGAKSQETGKPVKIKIQTVSFDPKMAYEITGTVKYVKTGK